MDTSSSAHPVAFIVPVVGCLFGTGAVTTPHGSAEPITYALATGDFYVSDQALSHN